MDDFDAAAQPLRWWRRSQLDEFARVLAAPWAAWLGDWRADAPLARDVACGLAWDEAFEPRQWAPLASGSGPAWIACDAPVDAILFGRGGCAPASVASRLAAQAKTALARGLADALGLHVCEAGARPAPFLFKPWSGAVRATLGPDEETSLHLLLDGDVVERLVRKPPTRPHAARMPLVPLKAACRSRAVSASVHLASCELDLGTLASLRAGDVIPISHALDQPLEIRVAGRSVCGAFLGRSGHTKAVELARLPS